MANPTSEQIFNVDIASVNSVLGILNLPTTQDARTAAASILDLLAARYKLLVDAGISLNAYTIVEEFENVDLTTQSQNFTITFERAITVGAVLNEPV